MIVFVVDFPASVPPVRSGGTPMVVGGAFATHQLRPKECHRGTANTRPCEPPARTIRFGIAAGEALPDVSRCLAFMSPLEVARFAFSTLTCSGLESTAQTDDKSPASESPGAKTALSCLGNVRRSPRTPEVVPQAKGVTPFGAFQTSLRSRARSKLPHLVHRGARLCSGPSRAPRAAAVASELRCTHGLGAHPRLARGMFRRLQQSTISVFKDEHPRHASRFDIDRAVRSSERRRKPPFTTRLPLRCVDWIQPGIGRMNRDRRSL